MFNKKEITFFNQASINKLKTNIALLSYDALQFPENGHSRFLICSQQSFCEEHYSSHCTDVETGALGSWLAYIRAQSSYRVLWLNIDWKLVWPHTDTVKEGSQSLGFFPRLLIHLLQGGQKGLNVKLVCQGQSRGGKPGGLSYAYTDWVTDKTAPFLIYTGKINTYHC